MGDRNVQEILVAIARCLTDERIEDLRDRLIFVQWQDGVEPMMTETVISAESFTIPIHNIVVPDFCEIFEVLGRLERRFSVRVLRHLKEQVFDLVQAAEPTDRVYVTELDPDVDASRVEVVIGVGAIRRFTTSYVGLERPDLQDDVLDDRGYEPARVVSEALARLVHSKWNLPVYKCLRAAGHLAADGSLLDPDAVPKKVSDHVECRVDLLKGLKDYERRAGVAWEAAGDFATMVDQCTDDDLMYFLPFVPEDEIDCEQLLERLRSTRHIRDSNRQPVASQWVKGVCLYDWLVHGPVR